jgi:hypothetical protein
MLARTYTSSGTLKNVDSFFYDVAGQLIRADDYDNTLTKVKSTIFVYNGDNTMNSASVTYVSPTNPNEYYENTYGTGGQLLSRKSYVANSSGIFQLITDVQFLAYDNKANPFVPIYQNYLLDQFNLFAFVYASPNNFTSAKEIFYDATTGNISNLDFSEVSYSYNSNNLPAGLTATDGTTITKYNFTYIQQ